GEHRLELRRVDVLAARDQHVLLPVVDVEVALGVPMADVAGAEPSALGEGRRGGRGIAPVAGAEVRPAKPDLAPLAGGDVGPGGGAPPRAAVGRARPRR